MKTYIFVHNQDIIIDFIEYGKFNHIDNIVYVLVGNGDYNKIEGYDSVIVCNNLPINIEQYPQLTSFSGWYALWKNNLIDEEYINLFEYDVNIPNNFEEVMRCETINKDIDIFGYFDLAVTNPNLIAEKHCMAIKKSIDIFYNVNILEFIENKYNFRLEDYKEDHTDDFEYRVSCTSNYTFKKDIFFKYMEWMEPMIYNIAADKYSGHNMERSIIFFYILNDIENVKIISDWLFHFQNDSHNTQDKSTTFMYKNYYNLITNENFLIK